MLVMCVHTWNPKTEGLTEKDFLPRREKWQKELIAQKVPVRSLQSVFDWKQGRAWCLWETDTVERLEAIMAQHAVHTEIVPVKQAPQIM